MAIPNTSASLPQRTPAYITRRPRARRKIEATMGEFKRGTLHSGSDTGPEVTDRKQAIAIALNQGRKAGRGMRIRSHQGGHTRPHGRGMRLRGG